jgi:hypothetical protein
MRYLRLALVPLLLVACTDQAPVAPDALSVAADETTPAATGASTSSPNQTTNPFRGEVFVETITVGFTPCFEIPGFPPPDPELCSQRCTVTDPSLVGRYSASGHATYLGTFELSQEHCTVLQFGPAGPVGALYGEGEFVITAANGDEIVGTYGSYGADQDGISVPVADEPGVFAFSDILSVTGGTGRFVDASGSVWDTGEFLGSTGEIIEWTMHGSITYAASNRSNH